MIQLIIGVNLTFALQGGQATISGVVRSGGENSGIAGAVVTLTELDRATTADADGSYAITGVPPGPHHMVIRRLGFMPRTLHALVPVTGTLEINVVLSPIRLPAHLPAVVVRRPMEIRGWSSTDSVSLADETNTVEALRNNPMLTQPDILQALSGGEITIKPEFPGGFHIRGGGSDQTSYVLDGIPIFNPYHASGIFSAWNPDALSHVTVASAMPSPAYPSTLSGTVAAFTRTPGSEVTARSSISTTHTGLTVDGPLGSADGGFLASVRFAYPHFNAPPNDASYLHGASNDYLLKLDASAIGGRLKLLGYRGANEMSASAETDVEAEPGVPRRKNTFEWQSHSIGFEWNRTHSRTRLRILGWSVAGDSESMWNGSMSRLLMTAERVDNGLILVADRRFRRVSVSAGVKLERTRNSYVVQSDSVTLRPFETAGAESLVTFFTQYSVAAGNRADFRAGASIVAVGGSWFAGPQAELRLKHSGRLTSSVSYARTHQFVQSLRNPESVTAGIFPADLFAGVGAPGVPVARSDLGVVATAYRPTPDTRIGLQAWQRRFNNILLVAPFDDEPFATRPFGIGRGSARGGSIDVSVSATRYGITASYGIQRVRYSSGALQYAPDHGPTHLFEGGVLFFPTATSSIRVGVAHSAGRRTTAIGGQFEWESCNLRDKGCEFAGTPRANGEPLGEQYLPSYLRFDLGARKHWHFDVVGRDAMVALFGALTNVFDRSNVLTYTRDPATGTLSPIDMRPRAPLVVGLEWRL